MDADSFGARRVKASEIGGGGRPGHAQCTVGEGSVTPTPLGPVTSNASVSGLSRSAVDCGDLFVTVTVTSTSHPRPKSIAAGVVTTSASGAVVSFEAGVDAGPIVAGVPSQS